MVMASARQTVRKAARIGGFGFITAVLLPLYVTHGRLARPRDRGRVRDLWVRRWSDSLLRLFSIDVEVSPSAVPEPQAGQGQLVVANHRSALDIGILLRHFGGHMVSRADLAGWPLVGAAARSVGTVFVDRESTTSGASTIRAVRTLLKKGETVIVFPEGTTFEGDVVRPFSPGAFIGALTTGARIVPVGIAYQTGSGAAFVGEAFVSHLSRMAGSGRTRVAVRVGEPIDVGSAGRAKDLSIAAHDAVQALSLVARRAVDA
jgi:lyso-ornithine lipid O-acyltransferase